MVKKTSENSYDAIIVGSSFVGILAAYELTQAGRKILLLEAGDQYGKTYATTKWQDLEMVAVANGMYLGADDSELFQRWSSHLSRADVSANHSRKADEFLTDGGPELTPFLGFGETAPAFYECVEGMLHGQRLSLHPPLGEILEAILERIPHRQTLAEVSKVYFSGEGNQAVLMGLQINSAKDFYCESLIWCESPRQILGLLPSPMVPHKLRTKWNKKDLWATIGLDLYFKSAIFDSSSSLVLMGSNRENPQPIFGHSWPEAELRKPNTEEAEGKAEGQVWRWLAFLEEDLADEPENVNEVLKRMRRLIKKHIPIDEASERIAVWPSSAGSFDSKDESGLMHLNPQVQVVHFSLSRAQGIGSELRVAEKLLTKILGFNPWVQTEASEAGELDATSNEAAHQDSAESPLPVEL